MSSRAFVLPVDGKITSRFGYRKLAGSREFHNGVDFSVPVGTPVKNPFSGVVSSVGYNNSRGNYVTVTGDNGIVSTVQHLSAFRVAKGSRVSAGQVLGLSGNTGRSTGPHLHLEMSKAGKPFDPLSLENKTMATIGESFSLSSVSGSAGSSAVDFARRYWFPICAGLLLIVMVRK